VLQPLTTPPGLRAKWASAPLFGPEVRDHGVTAFIGAARLTAAPRRDRPMPPVTDCGQRHGQMRWGGRAYNMGDVERIGALGLDFAEINLLQGMKLIHEPGELLAASREWGLSYLVHAQNEGDPCDLERLGGPFYREILLLLDLCDFISSPLLTVHFWMDGRFIPAEVVERKRPILWAMAEEGFKRGVHVCVENLSERPEDLRPLLDGCPRLGLTLDIGHGQLLTRGNRSLEFLELWPHRIQHVHAHDNRGGDRVGDDLHLPIGAGVIDFTSIFRALVRARYEGTVTLEVPVEHLPSSVQSLRRIAEEASWSLP